MQKPRQLRAAADYIENAFTNAGYKVTRQSYEAGGETCFNLEAEKIGKTRRNEIVVVGAHYDSVTGSPGANDNGSGIAAVLSLARAWSERDSARTIRFHDLRHTAATLLLVQEVDARTIMETLGTRKLV